MILLKYPISQYEKDPENLHFYVLDVRILTPDEYNKFKTAIPKEQYKTIFNVLLITGVRYIEMLRLYDNPEWYNEKRNIINLPEEAQQKHNQTLNNKKIRDDPEYKYYQIPNPCNYCSLT